jgi:hypothetical protein
VQYCRPGEGVANVHERYIFLLKLNQVMGMVRLVLLCDVVFSNDTPF